MRDGQSRFSQVPTVEIPRSVFNRTHTHKTTFDSGLLIPIFIDEALPGDTFSVHTSLLARLATPIFPIMDNMSIDVFFFAIPNRLLWDNWQKFMGEQLNPGDSTDYLVPVMNFTGTLPLESESIWDYFGLPLGLTPTQLNALQISALPWRAYNLVYNEWFRDENLSDRRPLNGFATGDGPDTFSWLGTDLSSGLLRRGKRHDYFTSCLPWPQKGPGTEIPIVPAGTNPTGDYPLGYPTFRSMGDANDAPAMLTAAVTTGNVSLGPQDVGGPMQWADPGLVGTINSLRQAFQVQRLLEKDARGGTRYTEILRAHFGVVSPDARLQRPEYLGGGSVPVIVNPVSQTSGTAPTTGGYSDTPQGNQAAFAVANGRGLGFTKSFVEHSVILGLACARADLTYQQGLHKMWNRRTRFDYYWPSFAHLGEQAVLNKEIYAQGTTVDDEVFGYQERWAEYRYYPSRISGKFRSTDPQSLDAWHLAQEFTELPVLSEQFIWENPPVDRVVAVTDEPDFIADMYFQMKCVRPMPTFSVPGLVDHF